MTLKDLKKKEKSEPLKWASHEQCSVPHYLRPTINSSNRQRVIPVSSASSPAASRSANSNTKGSFLGNLHVSTDIEITPTYRADSITINMPKSSEKRSTRDRNSQSDAASSGSSGLGRLSNERLQRPRSPVEFFSEPRRKKSSRSSSAAAPDVARATCSSASKQFSRSGERMACSNPRCRYAYCSLNHLEQNPLPSIKRFMAAQRLLRRQSFFKRVGRASLLKKKGRLDDKFASVDTGQEVDVDEDASNLFFEFCDHSAGKEGNLESGYDIDSQFSNNDDDGDGYTEIQIQMGGDVSDFCEPDGNVQKGELVIASADDDDEEEGALSPGGHLDDSPLNEADPSKKISGQSEYQGEEIWESGFHRVHDSDDIDDSDSEENRNDGFEEADSPPQEIQMGGCVSNFCEPDGNVQNGELVIAFAADDDEEEEGADDNDDEEEGVVSPRGHLDDSPLNEADPGQSEYQGEEIWESGLHQVRDSDDIDDSDSKENRNDGFEEADSTPQEIQMGGGVSDFCEPDGNVQNDELVIASADDEEEEEGADDNDDEEEGAVSPRGHLDDSPLNEADPGQSEYQGEEIWESGFHQVRDSDDIDDSDSEENRNDGFEEADSPPQEITGKECEDSNPALVPRIDVQNINMGDAQSNACDGDLKVVDLQPFEGPDIQSPKSTGQDEIQQNEALEEAASEDIKPDLPVAKFEEDVHVLDESDIDRQLDSKPDDDCIVVQEISKDSINAGEGNHDKAQIPVEFESTQKTNDDSPSYDVQEGYDKGLEQGTAESVILGTEGPDEVTADVISDKVRSGDTFDADGVAVFESGQDNKLRKIFELLAEMQNIKDEHDSDAFAAAKKSIESLLESVTSSRFSDLQISKSGDSSRSGDADANMQGSVCGSDNSGDCHSEASDDKLMGNARDDCINIFKSFLDRSPDCSYDVSGSVKKWERAEKSAADNKSPSGRNFWRRRRVHPFVEENSGPESVHLRHLDLSDRKPSSEWMIDYILREIIRTLAPFRKRKVDLLVQAFEAVAPMAANSEARTVPVKDRKSQEKNGKGKT